MIVNGEFQINVKQWSRGLLKCTVAALVWGKRGTQRTLSES